MSILKVNNNGNNRKENKKVEYFFQLICSQYSLKSEVDRLKIEMLRSISCLERLQGEQGYISIYEDLYNFLTTNSMEQSPS